MVLLVLGSVVGCRIRTEPTKADAPARPAAVPAQAIWTGGHDGGVFLIVRPAGGNADAYSAEIYHDYSGDILYRGRLLIQPAKSGTFSVKDAASYSGWDGDTLYLADGRRLVKPPGG